MVSRDIFLVICHDLWVIHSLTMSYSCIATSFFFLEEKSLALLFIENQRTLDIHPDNGALSNISKYVLRHTHSHKQPYK